MPEIKTINGQHAICVSIPEMEKCGVSLNTLWNGLSRQRIGKVNNWPHHKEGQSIYLHYDGLATKYQELIRSELCNGISVKDYVQNQEIESCFVIPNDVVDFFRKPLPNGNRLTNTQRQQYQRCAAVLLFMSMNKTKEQRLQSFKINDINEYYNRIALFIKSNKLPLPTNKGNLISKVKEFEKYGPECLVTKKLRNINAGKIILPEQIAILMGLAADYRNLDGGQMAMIYNEQAIKSGWELISAETCRRFRLKNRYLTTSGSKGKKAWEKGFAMQHRRIPPSMPLIYATLDGWDVELMYQTQTEKIVKDKKTGKETRTIHTEYANRHCIVIVLDPFNKYPLGYAIGDQESSSLIKMALKNSLDHIKELTGHYYYPYQIQSDHYALKKLTPYYQAISHLFTPAAVGNSKSKIIEPYFKYLNKQYCQFKPNWSGFGMESRKENRPNRDYINTTIVKKQFPTKDENIEEIINIIETERKLKLDTWMQMFQCMGSESLCEMSREAYLETFGVVTGRTNRILGVGVEVQIAGKKFLYDTNDKEFRKYGLMDCTLVFDQGDLTSVLAIPVGSTTQFLLHSKHLTHMAIFDQTQKDIDYQSLVEHTNQDMIKEITDEMTSYRATISKYLENNPTLAETRVKMMFTERGQQKDNLKLAEKAMRQLPGRAEDNEENDIYIKMFDAGLCNPKKAIEEEDEFLN